MNDIPVPEMADKARDALIAHGFFQEQCDRTMACLFMCVIPMGNKIELYGKGAQA